MVPPRPCPLPPPYVPAAQTGILSHVCQLTQLRSLSMELDCRYASVEDDMNDNAAVPVHDPSSLRHLISALTALARLDLDLPHY